LIEGGDMATTLPPSSASYLGVFRPPYPFTAPPGGKPRGTYAAVENQTLLIRETGHF